MRDAGVSGGQACSILHVPPAYRIGVHAPPAWPRRSIQPADWARPGAPDWPRLSPDQAGRADRAARHALAWSRTDRRTWPRLSRRLAEPGRGFPGRLDAMAFGIDCLQVSIRIRTA